MATTQQKLPDPKLAGAHVSDILDPIKKKTGEFGRAISYDEVKFKNYSDNRPSADKSNDKKTEGSAGKSQDLAKENKQANSAKNIFSSSVMGNKTSPKSLEEKRSLENNYSVATPRRTLDFNSTAQIDTKSLTIKKSSTLTSPRNEKKGNSKCILKKNCY
jgi:hypothetical protein